MSFRRADKQPLPSRPSTVASSTMYDNPSSARLPPRLGAEVLLAAQNSREAMVEGLTGAMTELEHQEALDRIAAKLTHMFQRRLRQHYAALAQGDATNREALASADRESSMMALREDVRRRSLVIKLEVSRTAGPLYGQHADNAAVGGVVPEEVVRNASRSPEQQRSEGAAAIGAGGQDADKKHPATSSTASTPRTDEKHPAPLSVAAVASPAAGSPSQSAAPNAATPQRSTEESVDPPGAMSATLPVIAPASSSATPLLPTAATPPPTPPNKVKPATPSRASRHAGGSVILPNIETKRGKASPRRASPRATPVAAAPPKTVPNSAASTTLKQIREKVAAEKAALQPTPPSSPRHIKPQPPPPDYSGRSDPMAPVVASWPENSPAPPQGERQPKYRALLDELTTMPKPKQTAGVASTPASSPRQSTVRGSLRLSMSGVPDGSVLSSILSPTNAAAGQQQDASMVSDGSIGTTQQGAVEPESNANKFASAMHAAAQGGLLSPANPKHVERARQLQDLLGEVEGPYFLNSTERLFDVKIQTDNMRRDFQKQQKALKEKVGNLTGELLQLQTLLGEDGDHDKEYSRLQIALQTVDRKLAKTREATERHLKLLEAGRQELEDQVRASYRERIKKEVREEGAAGDESQSASASQSRRNSKKGRRKSSVALAKTVSPIDDDLASFMGKLSEELMAAKDRSMSLAAEHDGFLAHLGDSLIPQHPSREQKEKDAQEQEEKSELKKDEEGKATREDKKEVKTEEEEMPPSLKSAPSMAAIVAQSRAKVAADDLDKVHRRMAEYTKEFADDIADFRQAAIERARRAGSPSLSPNQRALMRSVSPMDRAGSPASARGMSPLSLDAPPAQSSPVPSTSTAAVTSTAATAGPAKRSASRSQSPARSKSQSKESKRKSSPGRQASTSQAGSLLKVNTDEQAGEAEGGSTPTSARTSLKQTSSNLQALKGKKHSSANSSGRQVSFDHRGSTRSPKMSMLDAPGIRSSRHRSTDRGRRNRNAAGRVNAPAKIEFYTTGERRTDESELDALCEALQFAVDALQSAFQKEEEAERIRHEREKRAARKSVADELRGALQKMTFGVGEGDDEDFTEDDKERIRLAILEAKQMLRECNLVRKELQETIEDREGRVEAERNKLVEERHKLEDTLAENYQKRQKLLDARQNIVQQFWNWRKRKELGDHRAAVTFTEELERGPLTQEKGIQNEIQVEYLPRQILKMVKMMKREEVFRGQLDRIHALVMEVEATNGSLKTALTCTICGQVFEDPVVLWPCGHSFCAECFETLNVGPSVHRCSVCGSIGTEAPVPNAVLDFLVARWQFQMSGYSNLRVSVNDVAVHLEHFHRQQVEKKVGSLSASIAMSMALSRK